MKVWVEIPVSDEAYTMSKEIARRSGVALKELYQELITDRFTNLLQRARSAPAGDV